MQNAFVLLAGELDRRSVRYVTIGVSGANYYALSGSTVFHTEDRDLFLPLDPENLKRAWQACEATGFDLRVGREPLDYPRDLWLAERMVGHRALTKAFGPGGMHVDLTLVMGDFEFEPVWKERRTFLDAGAQVQVARLKHIVDSKVAANRPKDQVFLETHKEALRQLLDEDGPLS
ncbi:MAG: hypothetical protein IPJ77_01675 [Planctomycetes bacterium]|nr:hypothetical protein [Planctomycetota bacterium]